LAVTGFAAASRFARTWRSSRSFRSSCRNASLPAASAWTGLRGPAPPGGQQAARAARRSGPRRRTDLPRSARHTLPALSTVQVRTAWILRPPRAMPLPNRAVIDGFLPVSGKGSAKSRLSNVENGQLFAVHLVRVLFSTNRARHGSSPRYGGGASQCRWWRREDLPGLVERLFANGRGFAARREQATGDRSGR
jgi:hypothetical protein